MSTDFQPIKMLHSSFKRLSEKSLQESPTTYRDQPISKTANINQTPDENKLMWAKVLTIININGNGFFQRK